MKLESAKYIKEMYEERESLLKLLEISENYDFELKASFRSVHNHNKVSPIYRECKIPQSIQDEILDYVRSKVEEINKKIDGMELFL